MPRFNRVRLSYKVNADGEIWFSSVDVPVISSFRLRFAFRSFILYAALVGLHNSILSLFHQVIVIDDFSDYRTAFSPRRGARSQ
jgi:hypothetical protein